MQIMMHEIGLCDTVDPLAGSYFVETMTNRMETLVVEIMERLHADGGIVRGVMEGGVQADVNRQAFERERRLQSGELKKVGVNCYVEEEEERAVEFHPYRERLKCVRRWTRCGRTRATGGTSCPP
jgi:methylmalonyl-CoA mutase N-terminal domain/subunit